MISNRNFNDSILKKHGRTRLRRARFKTALRLQMSYWKNARATYMQWFFVLNIWKIIIIIFFSVGTWSEWSSCIVTQKCSNGTQSRTCIGPGDCPSGEETVQLCTTQNDEECSSVTLVQEGLNCEQHCNKTGYNILIIHYNETYCHIYN